MVHAFEWLPDFIFYAGAGTEEEELAGVAELEGEGVLEVEGELDAEGELEGELDVEGELEGDVELDAEGELDADAGGKKLPSLPSCATRYITAAESTIILSIPTKAAIYSTYLFYKCLRPL
jgi:hypothetical protein